MEREVRALGGCALLEARTSESARSYLCPARSLLRSKDRDLESFCNKFLMGPKRGCLGCGLAAFPHLGFGRRTGGLFGKAFPTRMGDARGDLLRLLAGGRAGARSLDLEPAIRLRARCWVRSWCILFSACDIGQVSSWSLLLE